MTSRTGSASRSASSSQCSTSSRACAARPTSTAGTSAVAARPRLAVTLGDPRGIGPEVVARALATPLDADITAIGADEQISDLPAVRKVGVGVWEWGTGDEGRVEVVSTHPASLVPRPALAGRLAGLAVEKAV